MRSTATRLRRRTDLAGSRHAASTVGDPAGATSWSRARLHAILISVVALALVLVMGLGYTVRHLLTGAPGQVDPQGDVVAGLPSTDPADIASARGPGHRDEVAAALMLAVPPSAARPPPGTRRGADVGHTAGAASGAMSAVIDVPTGTGAGPAFVETGFPHTPVGALAQLAQIEVSVLGAMSLPSVADVHQAWTLPGGARIEDWALTAAVQAFLDGAGMRGAKDPAATVAVTPVGGLIKGADGPDWVVACVLTVVAASYRDQQSHTSFGHCERMQWAGGRWLIAPGAPPAPAPSTWPGTDLATEAGWRTWHTPLNPAGDGPGGQSAPGVQGVPGVPGARGALGEDLHEH